MVDLNRQAVAQVVPRIHSHKIHKVLQVTSVSGGMEGLEPGSGASLYNLFATGALSDGIKLWDLRQLRARGDRDPLCVQRFDWPGSDGGRLAPGFDLSPCLKFLSVASEDGFCYVFDTRKPGKYLYWKKPALCFCPVILNFSWIWRVLF